MANSVGARLAVSGSRHLSAGTRFQGAPGQRAASESSLAGGSALALLFLFLVVHVLDSCEGRSTQGQGQRLN